MKIRSSKINNNDDKLKQSDQLALLKTCAKFTETGEWDGKFVYPNCGWDLVLQGLVTEDKKITEAGKAVLWFTDNGPDPTPGKTYVEFTMPLRDKMND